MSPPADLTVFWLPTALTCRALERVAGLERRIEELSAMSATRPKINRARLLQLAHDLPAAWNAQSTDTRTKQRLIHIVVQEIVCDLDDATNEAVLLIHWTGGIRRRRAPRRRYLHADRNCQAQ